MWIKKTHICRRKSVQGLGGFILVCQSQLLSERRNPFYVWCCETAGKNGLSSPDLHLIFDTMISVSFQPRLGCPPLVFSPFISTNQVRMEMFSEIRKKASELLENKERPGGRDSKCPSDKSILFLVLSDYHLFNLEFINHLTKTQDGCYYNV